MHTGTKGFIDSQGMTRPSREKSGGLQTRKGRKTRTYMCTCVDVCTDDNRERERESKSFLGTILAIFGKGEPGRRQTYLGADRLRERERERETLRHTRRLFQDAQKKLRQGEKNQ